MAAYLGKYHIGLDSKGYIISQRGGRRYYQKRRAPTFVNKFGGGDSSYRDGTYWQYFVQTNWRNGAKQKKWDDPGKFWKSSNVNITQLEELTLSYAMTSAGQLAAGIKVNALEPWRSSASWWNASYGYRQQLTITNNATSTAPTDYPVKVTIDTSALQTASKVRSDRKDWRIVYWNGSSWVDLSRDYVSASVTFFPLQAAISAGASDNNYYAYYGYASESTDMQPSTEAQWNTVYGFYGSSPDANSVVIHHFREGTGSSLNDDSSNSITGTASGSPAWATDGKFGRYLTFDGSNDEVTLGNSATLDLGSLTLEGWFYVTATTYQSLIAKRADNLQGAYALRVHNSHVEIIIQNGVSQDMLEGSTTIGINTWYHLACTYDGSNTAKVYVNGTLDGTKNMGLGVYDSSYDTRYGRDENGNRMSGRMQHTRISNTVRTTFPYVLSSEPSISSGTETTTQPPSNSFDLYGGGSDGKIYKWDGTTTWTEQHDVKRIVWYETGNDANEIVGDEGGTEKAKSQGFQVSKVVTVSGASFYLKKNAGTPGNITVRIETNNSGVPSGTLVDSNATGTITSFSTTSYGWVSVTFAGVFALAASTTYHIVLKLAAGANDNNYAWAADASSPSFSSGSQSYSTDGGSTWTADATKDQYFRLLGQSTSVNCMKVTSVGGTQKMYIGTGSPTGITNGDARLYSFDGSTYALTYGFDTSTESVINSIEEFSDSAYIGVGPQAKVYKTANFSSFTLSKDINTPQYPGYIYAMKEYNYTLYAGGGSPEFLPDKFYNGFIYTYDSTTWRSLYPFDFTVIRSFEFYDSYLFMGTYHGDLYVYDTSSLNPLFNWKDLYNYRQEVKALKYHDDKLYIGLYPQENSNDTNDGIWVFERHGLSEAHSISGVTGYRCFATVNGKLFVGTGDDGYVYYLDTSSYVSTGYYESSYFDANLPSINKIYNTVTIKHDPLSSGHSINVHYRFKDSDSWTSLGTSDTVAATEKTLSFSSGVYSTKIQLKVTLNTTNSSSSPKLTEVIMQYSLYPPRKWQWTMRLLAKKALQLLDRTTEARSATTIRSDLETLLNTQSLFTYVDVDGTSYTVLVSDIDQTSWVVQQDDVNEDEIVLTLLEA